jgi:hypothetical protein
MAQPDFDFDFGFWLGLVYANQSIVTQPDFAPMGRTRTIW